MTETQTTLAVFAVYVGQGDDRSLRQLRQLLKARRSDLSLARVPSLRTLERWSIDLDWQSRLDQIVQAAEAQVRQQLIGQQAEAVEHRRKLGLSLQQQGLQVLRGRAEGDWTVRDALTAVTRGSDMELGAAGTTERAAGGDVMDQILDRVRGLTDEQLERLADTDGGADGPRRAPPE